MLNRLMSIGGMVAVTMAVALTTHALKAQSVVNERRNRASSFDQAKGEYYTGRSPDARQRMAVQRDETSPSSVESQSDLSSPSSSESGFGPSHSTVILEGIE